MSDKYIAVAEILIEIEKELRELRLWEFESPSEDALASTQPFAIDTLNFPQWLQFIFVPRLYLMAEQRLSLPRVSGVKPMAEEYFRVLNLNSALLIAHLEKMDKLLSE
ncbi:MAG: YqcC family protein [Gammaproteobacteria bacterium]|nr:MAG: YqcC family protein [Gammaproteobacteria bacterium]